MKFLVIVALSFLLAACGGSPPPAPTPASNSVLLPGVQDTSYSEGLRRIREEHEALIASIPPTPGAEPTLTAPEEQSVAIARGHRFPDGEPAPPPVGEDWFDPEYGIEFYRDSGGDWTSRRIREIHPHRDLFAFDGSPDSIPNFHAWTIQRDVAREMVFEAVDALSLLGEPTPAMIEIFRSKLGWELRHPAHPVVNFWTTFDVRRGCVVQSYAVGGVMRLGVASVGEGEETLEYFTVARWLGPVVVERLR